ncbi:MAG: hypothetical protein R2856_34655 [Caldilineaceae bacterium]
MISSTSTPGTGSTGWVAPNSWAGSRDRRPGGRWWMAYNNHVFGGPVELGYSYSELWVDQHHDGFMSLSAPTGRDLGHHL